MRDQVNGQSGKQYTLSQSIPYVGVGLHTGKKVSMVIQPNPEATGIYFMRSDVPRGQGLVLARWYNVVDTYLSTVLGNEYGVTVSTVEHLLAALHGCGIDHAIIRIDGPEVPIMDGSAEPFVSTLTQTGIVPVAAQRNGIWIFKPVEVREGDRFAILVPSARPRMTVSIDFPDTMVGTQALSVDINQAVFMKEIAPARTFGFNDQLEALRRRGFAKGGTLRNAVLVDGDRVANREGLRYADEFVRHKVLDCIGDLSLAGGPILGDYYAHKPGHNLNIALVNKLFAQREKWSYVSIDDMESLQRSRWTRHLEERSRTPVRSAYSLPRSGNRLRG